MTDFVQLEADKDCEADKMNLIVKADELVRKQLEEKINDLKKKVEELQKEVNIILFSLKNYIWNKVLLGLP